MEQIAHIGTLYLHCYIAPQIQTLVNTTTGMSPILSTTIARLPYSLVCEVSGHSGAFLISELVSVTPHGILFFLLDVCIGTKSLSIDLLSDQN